VLINPLRHNWKDQIPVNHWPADKIEGTPDGSELLRLEERRVSVNEVARQDTITLQSSKTSEWSRQGSISMETGRGGEICICDIEGAPHMHADIATSGSWKEVHCED
jgi:hypothetical protein